MPRRRMEAIYLLPGSRVAGRTKDLSPLMIHDARALLSFVNLSKS